MSDNQPDSENEIPAALDVDSLTRLGKNANCMVLIGSPGWIRGVIYRLHTLGVAEVVAWSPLIPTT